jgi:hypothetical protein
MISASIVEAIQNFSHHGLESDKPPGGSLQAGLGDIEV